MQILELQRKKPCALCCCAAVASCSCCLLPHLHSSYVVQYGKRRAYSWYSMMPRLLQLLLIRIMFCSLTQQQLLWQCGLLMLTRWLSVRFQLRTNSCGSIMPHLHSSYVPQYGKRRAYSWYSMMPRLHMSASQW